MKIRISATLVCLIILSSFTFAFGIGSTESITERQHYMADKLFAATLFRGSDNGFELERTPTRAHAAVMLIRAMGFEEHIDNFRYNHGFTDVPSYANNHVGYLKMHNLTNGVSDTKFGSSNPVNARQYVTFMLRALGYSDKDGDFKYADALVFANDIGMLDRNQLERLAEGEFTRGDMVEVTFHALVTELKDSNRLLVQQAIGYNPLVRDESGLSHVDPSLRKYYATNRNMLNDGSFDHNPRLLDSFLLDNGELKIKHADNGIMLLGEGSTQNSGAQLNSLFYPPYTERPVNSTIEYDVEQLRKLPAFSSLTDDGYYGTNKVFSFFSIHRTDNDMRYITFRHWPAPDEAFSWEANRWNASMELLKYYSNTHADGEAIHLYITDQIRRGVGVGDSKLIFGNTKIEFKFIEGVRFDEHYIHKPDKLIIYFLN